MRLNLFAAPIRRLRKKLLTSAHKRIIGKVETEYRGKLGRLETEYRIGCRRSPEIRTRRET
jgi:hypothetical protein